MNTLKEKFEDEILLGDDLFFIAAECEKIADDYAIKFSQWIKKEVYYEHLTKEFIYKRNVYESEEQLLEIFKKQKGL